MKQKIKEFYNKNHKKILVIPAILLLFSVVYLGFFYYQHGEILYKDISLTGGTTITLFSDLDSSKLSNHLKQSLSDFEIRTLSDNSGKQTQVIITIPEEETEKIISLLEDYIGYKLNSDNSSIETTSSSLSQNFFEQLIIAVVLAFFWMSAIVFLIFAHGKMIKTWVIALNLLLGIILGNFLRSEFSMIIGGVILLVISFLLVYLYIKHSIPAFAVILCAFTDILFTLVTVNLLGMKISTAGIVAFLMLIGYSVDTDILLTSRVLKRKQSVNHEIFSSFKTGITMTMTAIIAILSTLLVIYEFESVLNQIFTILLIGLGFDIFNTWITNTSIIKWYVESKGE